MIRLIDIQKSYDNGTKALKGVNLRIDDGEFVFLVGPSGSGKSTILKLITAEIAPTGGRLMAHLLMAPLNDGGQWDMFCNLIEKYGVVPRTPCPRPPAPPPPGRSTAT